MLAATLQVVLLYVSGGYAFKMGNIRMQTRVTRYCHSDLVGADGKSVNCQISDSLETRGLVLPGMDDGQSLTTRQDIFLTKDGQLTVLASPGRPYEFIVMAHTTNDSHMIQLYNKTSFPIRLNNSRKQVQLKSLNYELTLDDHGWVHHGLSDVDGEKLHKRVLAKLNGTDSETGMNYTALALTGLIPNSWILYTDENDTRVVKLLATNNLHNDTVFQETVVTHWEELHENMTANDSLEMVYSMYDIEKHSSTVPSPREDPVPEAIFIDSEITGEISREFFMGVRNFDWISPKQLRGSNGTARGIDYFKILPGTASYKFFHAKAFYSANGATKFELPTGCTTNFIISKSPYCLYVNYNVNDTSLALDFFMGFQDVNQRHNNAHLNISVYYSSEGSVLNFSFDGGGCAVVWQMGVSFANLNIAVCISGSGAGKSLLQPDNATYRGAASISVSFNIDVPIVPTISATIEGGLKVQGAPHNDITASAYLKLSRSLLVVGADMWVEVVGNTVDHKINTWEFEAFFNLKVWVDILFWSDDWTWTWSLFKAGPVTF
ncbi:hypothetical protein FOL47_011316 [Perkinsus chesapeaki]|uniref:Uncharacterized protein n=1 Tax=Perkinsus chesapeaki TaxID=330153 RepID=A0A7J6KXB9_PERCH|nr:hypothetical protein FOL47_011316 [Perkinsus chesapeaki]